MAFHFACNIADRLFHFDYTTCLQHCMQVTSQLAYTIADRLIEQLACNIADRLFHFDYTTCLQHCRQVISQLAYTIADRLIEQLTCIEKKNIFPK